jgi:double-strand break repair protein MRE11
MANLDPAKPEEITRYLTDQVQNILTQLDSVPVDPKVSNMLGAIVPDPKMARLPLIRLKVEYTGFDTISAQRFGQQFVGKVANPNEILLFYRRKTSASIPKYAIEIFPTTIRTNPLTQKIKSRRDDGRRRAIRESKPHPRTSEPNGCF